jgi:hypothetical protein
LDLVTVFHVAFVVGLMAISILYVLFGTGAAGRNQNRAPNGREEGEEQERRGEEHGPGPGRSD